VCEDVTAVIALNIISCDHYAEASRKVRLSKQGRGSGGRYPMRQASVVSGRYIATLTQTMRADIRVNGGTASWLPARREPRSTVPIGEDSSRHDLYAR